MTKDHPRREPEEIYADPGVVEGYDPGMGLMPVELALFEEFVSDGLRVLDLGVGAGRTTAWLAPRAARYVAIDVVPAMVEACRRNFPDDEILLGDAADLSMFDPGSFDVVVFSFNGIDHLPDDAMRHRCLSECRRVLTDDGTFILSRHFARSLVLEPKRLRGVSWKLATMRLVRATGRTVVFASRRLFHRTFWRGVGYEFDTHHGGMTLAMTTPAIAMSELRDAGFEIERGPLPRDHPNDFRWWITPWFYLVAKARR